MGTEARPEREPADAGEDLRLTLDLGEFELSLQELMALRRGSCLELERPAELTGLLRCNGFPLAAVSVVLGAEQISLQVQEILLNPLPA